MNSSQHLLRSFDELTGPPDATVDLVLGFANKTLLERAGGYERLRSRYPNAAVLLCSSAGEIYGTDVYENTLSLLTLSFEHTQLRSRAVRIGDFDSSHTAGAALVGGLMEDDLRHIFILSDGKLVNGSELVKGMHTVIPARVPITGGLAGDETAFDYTLVGLNESPREGRIAAVALYGDKLRVAHGSFGGWESFGLERTVTKSVSNELFEIDGKNALDIYKEYLGKYAVGLPSSALYFPLSIQLEDGRQLVRTILGINEDNQSMIFAGDVPQGGKVKFMKASMDNLMAAAGTAAESVLNDFSEIRPEVAILISCVGRKLVLGARVDEEVEAVRSVLGPNTLLTGYYAYGEISPFAAGGACTLHNQTMTITCMQEVH